VLALTGCAIQPEHVCLSSQQQAVHDSIYFGAATPHGVVSREAWAHFVDSVITPRFPSGFTLLQASGQWRSAEGTIVREPSNVLEVVHPADRRSEDAVREIIDTYKTQLQQEAVLRIRSVTCVSFN
jgi:hypothetical protein